MALGPQFPPIIEDEDNTDNPIPLEDRTPWKVVLKVLSQNENPAILGHKFNWNAYEGYLKAHGWTIRSAKAKLRLADDNTAY